ncbi:MAG: pyridoxal-phosphate dependent enzyme, partial [Oscillospiraceae bacterium]|nr:pyridoxal-phosphate dependent enzyme [Oscillospiraceae bacterium]
MTLEEFKAARNVLSGVLNETRLIHSAAFSKATGNHVYIKPENMQVTGAYKIRGAYYKISTLTEEQKSRGLITASAGNHAQGVAYAAQAAGVSATICMPSTTPLVKVNNTKDYGAKVVLQGATFDDAADLAVQMAEEEGLTYIPPFNDLTVATGQGTIAYEIFQ